MPGRPPIVDEQGTPAAGTLEREGDRKSPTESPRRSRGWIVAAIVVALGGGAGAFYLSGNGRREPAGQGGGEHSAVGKQGSALPVEVTHPRPGGIERTTTQAGSVHAFEHAELFA